MGRAARLLAAAVGACCCTGATGWWNAGHMASAVIARTVAAPETVELAELLVSQLGQSFYPQCDSIAAMATWPDIIKARGLYEWSGWHYDDQPVHDEGTFPPGDEHEQVELHNVTWALYEAVSTLRSSKADQFTCGLSVGWLLHFLSDLHQPLHCAERYTPGMPEGDRGGNEVQVQLSPDDDLTAGFALPSPPFPAGSVGAFAASVHNLHALWDSAAGAYMGLVHEGYDPSGDTLAVNMAEVEEAAAVLMQMFPREKCLPGSGAYTDGVMEVLGHEFNCTLDDFDTAGEPLYDILNRYKQQSNDIAALYAYGNTTSGRPLYGLYEGESPDMSSPIVTPDLTYAQHAAAVAAYQITIGGYRLAAVLDSIQEDRSKLDDDFSEGPTFQSHVTTPPAPACKEADGDEGDDDSDDSDGNGNSASLTLALTALVVESVLIVGLVGGIVVLYRRDARQLRATSTFHSQVYQPVNTKLTSDVEPL